MIGLHKFNGEQVTIVVDGLRYPAAYDPSSNTFLIYLYNTTSLNKIEAILYSKGTDIQRVERVFKGENETGIFSGSVEDDAGQSGFVTIQQFLEITKQQPTTVMALVGFEDKKDADTAVSWYGKQGLRNIIKTACKNAEDIYSSKFNGISIKFYALEIDEIFPKHLESFNGLYVGFCNLNPNWDYQEGETAISKYSRYIGIAERTGNNTYIKVEKNSHEKLLKGLSYVLAHEYLHQWLSRAEYILYKNLYHMHNIESHLNLANYKHLNTAGDEIGGMFGDIPASSRLDKKEYRRIWDGHLFLLKNYNALCSENLEVLLPELKAKLNTEKRKKEYLFRIKNVAKGLDFASIIEFSKALNVGRNKVFSKEEVKKIIYNFQFN